MLIKGKVAAVLNERDLVINKGSDDSVSEGMLFQVTQPDFRITDPDSGAELGVIARNKIKVRVVEVHPQFSVAKTYETYSYPASPVSVRAGVIWRRRPVTRVRKIIMEPDGRKTDTIGVEGSTIRIGDPVVQITE